MPDFLSEEQMKQTFLDVHQAAVEQHGWQVYAEYEGLWGVPDVLLTRITRTTVSYVVAIELKLKNWRRAIRQAYKYRSFANEAYVALPMDRIQRPLGEMGLFERSDIGLIGVHRSGIIQFIHQPKPSRPYSGSIASDLAKDLACQSIETRKGPHFEPTFMNAHTRRASLGNALLS